MLQGLDQALKQHTSQKAGSFWLTIAVAVVVTVLVLLFRRQIEGLAGLGYAGAFILAVVGNAAVTVPIPWIFPVAAMGAVYNPFAIAIVAAAGAAIGETAPYLLGRRIAGHAGSTGIVHRMQRLTGAKKVLVVTGMAFSPVMSYPGLAGGMMGMPVWAICAVTLAGETFKVLLFTWAMAAGSRFLPSL